MDSNDTKQNQYNWKQNAIFYYEKLKKNQAHQSLNFNSWRMINNNNGKWNKKYHFGEIPKWQRCVLWRTKPHTHTHNLWKQSRRFDLVNRTNIPTNSLWNRKLNNKIPNVWHASHLTNTHTPHTHTWKHTYAFRNFAQVSHIWFVAAHHKPPQSNIQYYQEVNTFVTFLILSDFNQMYWEHI